MNICLNLHSKIIIVKYIHKVHKNIKCIIDYYSKQNVEINVNYIDKKIIMAGIKLIKCPLRTHYEYYDTRKMLLSFLNFYKSECLYLL